MAQRVFDIENEKDYADLWDIFPADTCKIELRKENDFYLYNGTCFTACIPCDIIKINWHDKTEITRPIQEATEQDVGKLCYFWSGKDYAIGILKEIGDYSSLDVYCMEDGKSGIWFIHCRRLTKQEIEELC